jgi:UDP-glucose 4-epimerase
MVRRRIVVTGAAGRVAGQLLPALEDAYELRLMDRAGDPDGRGDARLVVGDLTDRTVLDQVLDGVEGVVHLAGNPDPEAAWGQLREPNVEGFAALLAAAHAAGVRRVVFASSVHVMGAYEASGRWPVDPDWPPAPCCAYGATKAFDEALARVYAYRSDMSLIGLRLGLCTAEASAAQAVSGWLRPVDLQRIVIAALDAKGRFGIYHAVSWPSRWRWNIETAMNELGYEPERDDAQGAWVPEAGGGHVATCGPGTASGRGRGGQ